MYKYRLSNITYQTGIVMLLPDHTERRYASKVDIGHRKRSKTGWTVELVRKYDTLINGRPPVKIVDDLMGKLGESLYPICLKLDEGQRIEVENKDAVVEKWKQKSRELLEEYPTAEFRNYLKMAELNLTQPDFEKLLAKDTFFQLYFAGTTSELFTVTCNNFPINGQKTSFYARCGSDDLPRENSRYYVLSPVFESSAVAQAGGWLRYTFFPEGDINSIESEFQLTDAHAEKYLKRVHITVVKRSIQKGFLAL